MALEPRLGTVSGNLSSSSFFFGIFKLGGFLIFAGGLLIDGGALMPP